MSFEWYYFTTITAFVEQERFIHPFEKAPVSEVAACGIDLHMCKWLVHSGINWVDLEDGEKTAPVRRICIELLSVADLTWNL